MGQSPREINMFEWLNRTTLEMVAQSGLGRSLDSLKDGQANPYSIAIKNVLYVFPSWLSDRS